ncbi:hypothetical protein HSB1_45860 [Halogranum salarium B-1]|uniref:Uncharacterized protein n=1 Tax=Halogranum salarium B-1 TaxID=1210908 RepID=J2Z999_9EURY|nr:hypothetical protein HSB1_45860 [Halogranum salarium B-1]
MTPIRRLCIRHNYSASPTFVSVSIGANGWVSHEITRR